MFHHPSTSLALILGLGVLAQWTASRLRVPSILVLLLTGLAVGPALGLVAVDDLFGELLFPIVTLSVGAILFEGGLTLQRSELSQIGPALGRLVSVGCLITWVLAALAAHYVLGFSAMLATLLGAILTVTGPTVTLPLLSHIRPRGRVASLVKWEGIVIDPIGALLAVLTLEWLLFSGPQGGATGHAVLGMVKAASIGVGVGLAVSWILTQGLRRHLVPDNLESAVVLVAALGAFVLSNELQEEAGLFTVTLLGVLIANQKVVPIEHIVEFKENLTVLLLGSLFIMLGARVTWDQLGMLGPESLLFLGLLILVVRPAAVFLSLIGTGVDWREKLFVAVLAPRGIVAAAVASLFAIKLEKAGFAGAERLVPVVFLVIVGTVVVYGFCAGPIARRLGLASSSREGVLMLGAHPLARAIAQALVAEGVSVVLVDSNRGHISQSKLAGLQAYHASIRSDYVVENVPLDGIGRLLALVPNDEVNALAVLRFQGLFGRAEVYQLATEESVAGRLESEPPGRILFGESLTFWELEGRFLRGATIKRTNMTEDFDYTAFQALHGDRTVPLFVIREGGGVRPVTAERTPQVEPGDKLISLTHEPDPAPKAASRESAAAEGEGEPELASGEPAGPAPS